MKLDKKKERLMEELNQLSAIWLKDVKSLGNQTAYSEDILRSVLKKAHEIESVLDKQYGSCVQPITIKAK
ncbi:MAG: hypothetical protein IJF84_00355 [Thermoguttaceae bacterium]|nr:hypothetical protein [Thermoguttaceae bacterium]